MAQTILITGAGRGIGLELASQYAAKGDKVIASVRSGVPPALQSLTDKNPRVRIIEFDVSGDLAAAAAQVDTDLDLLICNAGVYRGRGSLADPDFEPDAWHETLMTNVAGPFFTVRAFLPHLERAGGKVAIISSKMASSELAPGGSYIYRASKAAATNLARNLAADLRTRGVAVGSYHPGWVRTDMGGSAADISAEESASGLIARFDVLSLESTGVFEDYRGAPIPF